MSGRDTSYNPFAWLYAHYWGDEYHCQAMPVLDRALLNRLAPPAAILDLCCGDGRIASALAQRGYEVTGVDASREMLRYARQRTPSVRFYLRDARRLKLRRSYDAVISTFDSLNHVLGIADLRKVFRNVYGVLNNGGYFLFDLNRENAYTELWVEMAGIVQSDVVAVIQSSFNAKRGRARCNMTQFRKMGKRWVRSNYELHQKHHPHEAVIGALKLAGFMHIASLDAANDLGMKGRIGVHRTFYLARK
jgi:SAM-dependent methyltransferase